MRELDDKVIILFQPTERRY